MPRTYNQIVRWEKKWQIASKPKTEMKKYFKGGEHVR